LKTGINQSIPDSGSPTLPNQGGTDRFSLNPVDDAIASTVSHDSLSVVLKTVVLKIPEFVLWPSRRIMFCPERENPKLSTPR
ncbi:MAG: hypothetical protein AAGH40_14760, partial [Verrucomicrobiota bacterium]